MGGYIANFTVYTMAMVGLICFAVFVYKKIMDGSLGKRHTRFIEIEDTLNLTPRKTLHVIRAGNEKFLIASDVDRTTLISRLEENSSRMKSCQNEFLKSEIQEYPEINQTFKEAMKGSEMKQKSQKSAQTKTQKVHLEPISRKSSGVGISNLRKNLDTRVDVASEIVKIKQTEHKPLQKEKVPVVVHQTRTANITMKDMAKKINEL